MKVAWIAVCIVAPVALTPAAAQVPVDATGQPGASAPPESTAPPTPRPRPGPNPRDQIVRDVLEGLIRDVVTPPPPRRFRLDRSRCPNRSIRSSSTSRIR